MEGNTKELLEGKKEAEEFLSEQIKQLTDEQKKALSYVLIGATIGLPPNEVKANE